VAGPWPIFTAFPSLFESPIDHSKSFSPEPAKLSPASLCAPPFTVNRPANLALVSLNSCVNNGIVYLPDTGLRSTTDNRGAKKMADGDGKIKLDGAIQLIFNDAAKNMSDLKLRQWSATNLAVAGIVGIVTFSQRYDSLKSQCFLTGFIISIWAAHFAIMWRCHTNLATFRSKLVKLSDMIRETIPTMERDLFAIVDEGTIVAIAYISVCIAVVFAILDIWKQIG
jgi:hypothetical protein